MLWVLKAWKTLQSHLIKDWNQDNHQKPIILSKFIYLSGAMCYLTLASLYTTDWSFPLYKSALFDRPCT